MVRRRDPAIDGGDHPVPVDRKIDGHDRGHDQKRCHRQQSNPARPERVQCLIKPAATDRSHDLGGGWIGGQFAPAVVALLKTIFAQETAEAAREQWAAVADALRERFPTLADLMDGSREDVLVYMAFPREHWAQIASTNPLERLNREIKRRADVVGIFPNDPAVIRLVGALMLEQNDEWAVSRRYMSLESLSALSDDPVLRLSAVAA